MSFLHQLVYVFSRFRTCAVLLLLYCFFLPNCLCCFFLFFFFCLVFHFVCRYYFCVLCLCWLYDRHLCSCACTLINTHWIEFNRIKVRRIDMLGLFHFHFCPYPKLPVIFPLSSCLLGICRISKTNMLINPLQNVPHPTTSTCCLCWTVPWLGTTHFQKCMYMQDV